MNKPKQLSAIAVLLLLIFFSETNVYADAIGASPLLIGGILLLIIIIIVGIVGLIAWLIIRSIRKNKK